MTGVTKRKKKQLEDSGDFEFLNSSNRVRCGFFTKYYKVKIFALIIENDAGRLLGH